MAYSFTDEQDYPRITPAVQWLIALNVAIYFLQLTLVRDADMFAALGFQMERALEGSWWTIGSYMFVHGGFWHLAFNMLLLWFFGPRVEHRWGSGSFTMYYLWCGLGGLLFHLLFARQAMLVGASAATLGVMLAYAMHWPDDEVLFLGVVPMKVKWLVALAAASDLLFGLAGLFTGLAADGARSGTAYMAHLGGLAFGWLWLRRPSAQGIERLRQRVSQIPDVPDDAAPRAIPRALPRPRERLSEADEIVAKSKAVVAKRPAPPTALAPPRDVKTDELNSVLDKISEHGMASLTKEERRLLEEMSKKLKGHLP